jgi:uncharacterized protein YbaA (DUF1428 family)
VLLQFYKDQAHADEVNAKMMQDESIGALMKEFGGLISQGSNLIMGGFSRLKVEKKPCQSRQLSIEVWRL